MLCYKFFSLNFSVVAYNILVVKMVFALHLTYVSCYQSLLNLFNLYSTKGYGHTSPNSFCRVKIYLTSFYKKSSLHYFV